MSRVGLRGGVVVVALALTALMLNVSPANAFGNKNVYRSACASYTYSQSYLDGAQAVSTTAFGGGSGSNCGQQYYAAVRFNSGQPGPPVYTAYYGGYPAVNVYAGTPQGVLVAVGGGHRFCSGCTVTNT